MNQPISGVGATTYEAVCEVLGKSLDREPSTRSSRELIGEFVATLPRIKSGEIVTTTFEPERRLSIAALQNAGRLKALGARVVHGVDATKLDRQMRSQLFKTIIFNFPNVASRLPVYGRNPNHHLAKGFLRSASQRLAAGGRIVVTLVDSPHYEGAFDLLGAAKFARLQVPEIFEFTPARVASYSHTNTLGNGSALRKYRKFKAWVFRR